MTDPENKTSIESQLDKEKEKDFALSLLQQINRVPRTMGQLELVEHIISKLPVTEALASAVFQEVLDYIGICLALNNSVEFTRLGLFYKEEDKSIVFKPSRHFLEVTRATTKLKAEMLAITSRSADSTSKDNEDK